MQRRFYCDYAMALRNFSTGNICIFKALTWTFTPSDCRKYVIKALCLVWPNKGATNSKDLSLKDAKKFSIRVIGEGKKGEVRVSVP